MATIGCGGSGAAKLPAFGSGLPSTPATPAIRVLEHCMSELVNRDRKKNALPPLAYDERLADVARTHSADMAKNHFFEHESPTYGKLEHRLTRAGFVYVTSRENLAEAPDIDEAEAGLLRSPHHYENLMATDITSIGIGIVRGGPRDPRNLTVTQIFATPGRVETDSAAAARVAQRIESARVERGLKALPRLQRLDAMAKRHLDRLEAELTPDNLKPVAKVVAEELAGSPIPRVSRVSVSGQIVVDSGQFLAQGALVDAAAKGYGMALRYAKDPSGAKRLKVLLLIGL